MAEYQLSKGWHVKRDGAVIGEITVTEAVGTGMFLKASGVYKTEEGGFDSMEVPSEPVWIYTYKPYTWRTDKTSVGSSTSLLDLLAAIRSFHEELP